MILFVSDIHFGKLSRNEEELKEKELISLIDSVKGEITQLHIVGDLYHEFMEYKTLVPKGNYRFKTRLQDLRLSGVEVLYFLGNRDPWHIDYFEEEFNLEIIPESKEIELEGRQIHIRHGDNCVPSAAYRIARPVMRNKFLYWLYRSLMPGDSSFRLARKVSNLIETDGPQERTTKGMRQFALDLLSNSETDLVIMGHSHSPEIRSTGHGVYVNLGSWADNRTFATLSNGKVQLLSWNDGKVEGVV